MNKPGCPEELQLINTLSTGFKESQCRFFRQRLDAKGRTRGLAQNSNKVSFGEYGLKTVGRGRIAARQIEAARRAIDRLQ